MLKQSNITIDVHLTNQDPDAVKDELRSGLLSNPRRLPTKYFYDDHGSALFERICDVPEYYPTRTEHQLLKTVADDVIARTCAEELVELGSGAATKTRVLLDAMARTNRLRFFVPFDFSEGIVRRVAQELVEEYEGLRVHGVVGDFLPIWNTFPRADDAWSCFWAEPSATWDLKRLRPFCRLSLMKWIEAIFFSLGFNSSRTWGAWKQHIMIRPGSRPRSTKTYCPC